jgi:hypothetical protein
MSSYQSILDSLPKMETPQEKTIEQIAAERKAVEGLAGVRQDPYADSRKRMMAMEERQGKANEEAGLNRLFAQLSAFATADPAKGIGYAGAVSAKASQELEEKQNALRDKQENAQIEFARAVEKEDDARKNKNAEGILAAQKDQQKAKFDFQKAEHDRGLLAASIYQTQETAESRRQAAKDAAAARTQAAQIAADAKRDTAQDPKDKLFNSIMGRYNQSKIAANLAKRLAEADIGSDEYNRIKREIYDEMKPYFSQNPDLLPPAAEVVAPSKPGKGPSWWDRNMPAILGGSPTVSFDQLPKN